eukprot:126310_1
MATEISLVDFNYMPLDAMNASSKSTVSEATNNNTSNAPTEISLFPMFDLWLKIIPVYYTKDRNRCLNILMLTIIIIILLSLPIFIIYEGIIAGYKPNGEVMIIDQVFAFIMYFSSFCAGFCRLYFFAKYFDFTIWHYQPVPLSSNRISIVAKDNPQRASYLLRQSRQIKSKIRKQLRVGAFIIFILYTLFSAAGAWTSIVFYTSNITDPIEKQQIEYQQFGWYSLNYLFQWLPDLLMICVVRLYFTECYLYITDFTKSINSMASFKFSAKSAPLLDDMLAFDIYGKYLKMYDIISNYCKQLNYFIMFWVVMITFVYWLLISLSFFTDWRSVDNINWTQELSLPLYMQLGVFAVQGFVAGVFMLWPAFKMTETFQELKVGISEKIQILMKDRAYLHDEKVLDEMTKNSSYDNMNSNIADLQKYISVYSKQKACLEILSQVSVIMNEKPCDYKLIGLALDRYSIRDFIVALFMGKIISYLWNSIN